MSLKRRPKVAEKYAEVAEKSPKSRIEWAVLNPTESHFSRNVAQELRKSRAKDWQNDTNVAQDSPKSQQIEWN